MKQLKQVYDMLEGNREILLSGHIIDACMAQMKAFKYFLDKDIKERFPGLDVFIWVCGYLVQNNIGCCKEIEKLCGFCDRDSRKQKKDFFGFLVISPEEFLLNHKDAVIVIGTGNYFEEIRAELYRREVPQEHIFNIGNYVPIASARQYFEEPFLAYGAEEVLVDVGAFDLFSTMRLQKIYGRRLKKAYAFEPDKANFAKCRGQCLFRYQC